VPLLDASGIGNNSIIIIIIAAIPNRAVFVGDESLMIDFHPKSPNIADCRSSTMMI
jgi:hypothetical protein